MSLKKLAWFVPVFGLLCSVQALAFDHSPWDGLLKKYLNQKHLFNYKALQKAKPDRSVLNAYTKALNKVSKKEFLSWSKNDRKAFLINAYNAMTIIVIVDYMDKEGAVSSIKDLGSLFTSTWKKSWPQIKLLDGTIDTLDGIEHDTLRKDYPDYRIHAAVNCASWSCPILRREAYQGSTLDATLDEQMNLWLKDSTRNQYDVKNKTLKLSKIFDWYAEDFGDKSKIKEIFNKYGPAEAKQVVSGDFSTSFLDYDWKLNQQ